MNDYTYLENMSRTVGLASKERKDMPLRKETGKLPLWVIEAGRLGLEVTLLGDGMQRRSENKSSWSKK